MDKIIVEKVALRDKFLIDHRLKYLELEALFPNKAGKLREIIESLPNGERKATAREILRWFHEMFQEVLKDYHALHEGSQLRNVLEDYVASIKAEK